MRGTSNPNTRSNKWDDYEKTGNVLSKQFKGGSPCSYLDSTSSTTLPNLAKPCLFDQAALWVFIGDSAGDAKATRGRTLGPFSGLLETGGLGDYHTGYGKRQPLCGRE